MAGKSISELNIILVTTAANTSCDDKSWLTENILEFTSRKPKSFDLIDIAGLSAELWQRHFDQADVICVGGGDEAYLARIFREQDVKSYLEEHKDEKVYMGISAGSVVAGVFLPKGLNVELYGEDCEADEGIGMEFYNFNYLPHLNSPYFPNITSEVIQSHANSFMADIIATDDFTAIKVDGAAVSFVGTGILQLPK